jgi:predicted transcriptional regulator
MICYIIKISKNNSTNIFLIANLSYVQFNKYIFDIYKGFHERNGHNFLDLAKKNLKLPNFYNMF